MAAEKRSEHINILSAAPRPLCPPANTEKDTSNLGGNEAVGTRCRASVFQPLGYPDAEHRVPTT